MTGTNSTGTNLGPSGSVRGLVVADGPTGANDTGHQFAADGFETIVALTDGTDVVRTDVPVPTRNSRHCSERAAADRVSRAIAANVGALDELVIDAFGPESPDTVWIRAASGAADPVVSIYHDRGQIPIEVLAFSKGADVSGLTMTVGLPIVRTSVHHGTTFDIAGRESPGRRARSAPSSSAHGSRRTASEFGGVPHRKGFARPG